MIQHYIKNRKIRLADGASLTPLASNVGVINGASHSQGGVDLGNVEVEGNEVMKQNPDGSTNVYSDKLGYAQIAEQIAYRKGQLEKMLTTITNEQNIMSENTGLDIPQRNSISMKLRALDIQKKPIIEEIQNLEFKLQELFASQQQENGQQQVSQDGQPMMAYGGKVKVPQLQQQPAVAESSAMTQDKPIRLRQNVSLPNRTNMLDTNVANNLPRPVPNYTPAPRQLTQEEENQKFQADFKRRTGYPQSGAITPDYTIEKTAASFMLPGLMSTSSKLLNQVGDFAIEEVLPITGSKGHAVGTQLLHYGRNKAVATGISNLHGESKHTTYKYGGKIKAWNGLLMSKPIQLATDFAKRKTANDINSSIDMLGGNSNLHVNAGDINTNSTSNSTSTTKKPNWISIDTGQLPNIVDSAMPFIDNIGNKILTDATPNVAAPTMTKVPKLNTKVDISSDINNVNDSIDSANKIISNYSSNPAAMIAASSVRKINALNPIYQNKRNQEAQLENRQLELIAANDASNAAKIDNYRVEQTKRNAGMLDDYSANLADMQNNILGNREFKANQNYQDKFLDVERSKYNNPVFNRYLGDFKSADDYINALKVDTPNMTAEREAEYRKIWEAKNGKKPLIRFRRR